MFQVLKFTILALAVASAAALVIPRSTPPAGWLTDVLEPYDTYHNRYLTLGCNLKHNDAFFNQCCHPLLATEELSARPPQCTPGPSSVSAPQSTASAVNNSDDDDDDCEGDGGDGDDAPASTFAPATSSSFAPATLSAAKPVTSAATASPQNAAVATTSTTSAPAKAAPTQSTSSTSSSVNTGGFATFFYQNGVAGACGKVHSDNDLIAAIDGDRYGNLGAVSPLCGKQVHITNANNGKVVTVTIADACPTCVNSNSIDLSEAAFKKIATLDEGIVPITWSFT